MTGSRIPGSKEIDVIVIISGSSSGGGATKSETRAGLGELLHAIAKGLDVVVPEEITINVT